MPDPSPFEANDICSCAFAAHDIHQLGTTGGKLVGGLSRLKCLSAAVAAVAAVVAPAGATATATAGATAATAAGAGLASAGAVTPASIPVPQNDPFYQPPSGFQSTAPGTILRSRPVQVAVFGILPQDVSAWQLLYRTTNYAGKPAASVTTVLRPAGSAPKAVVSYQIAEDSSAPQCAPSYELRQGINPGAAVNQAELLLIDAVVGKGFGVSIPDYEGFAGDFGAPRQPGYIVLDGLRAAESFKPLGLPGPSTPTGIWGYSGGSLASGWAAQLQASYAPKLIVRGVAVGGYVTNTAQAVEAVNGGPFAGLLPSVIPGVLKTNPLLARTLYKYLNAAGKAALKAGGTECESTNISKFAFANINKYTTIPLETLLGLPEVKSGLAALDLGATTPKAPMFVYQSVHDEVIPIAGVDAVVNRYCAHGGTVTYTRDELSEHASLTALGAPGALSWLAQRLHGDPVRPGCHIGTVLSMDLTWSALIDIPTFLIADLLGLLNAPGGLSVV